MPATSIQTDEIGVLRSVQQMSMRIAGELHRTLTETTGLSLLDYQVLTVVAAAPDSQLRAFELGEALQWEKSRLSHHLKRMEFRKLIDRVVCESDGRGLWVVLTRTGQKAFSTAEPVYAREVHRLLVSSLSPEQLDGLKTIVETVLAGIPEDDGLCDR